MTPHPKTELEIPLDDEDGEVLIEKAALMHRPDSFVAPDDDDLPVLTDVVDERVEPFIGDAATIILEPTSDEPAIGEPEMLDETPVIAAETALPDDLAERLVALDTAIARHIENWVATELPQLISRELDELAARISDKAAAHLRATLLPVVSAEIADTLDNDSGL